MFVCEHCCGPLVSQQGCFLGLNDLEAEEWLCAGPLCSDVIVLLGGASGKDRISLRVGGLFLREKIFLYESAKTSGFIVNNIHSRAVFSGTL